MNENRIKYSKDVNKAQAIKQPIVFLSYKIVDVFITHIYKNSKSSAILGGRLVIRYSV